MMDTDITKSDTLKFRMDAVTAEMMDRARSYVNLNKSKFIRHSIREKAEAIIAENEKTQFSRDDWFMFFDMLDSSFEPTKRMKQSADTYKQITSSDAV